MECGPQKAGFARFVKIMPIKTGTACMDPFLPGDHAGPGRCIQRRRYLAGKIQAIPEMMKKTV